MVVVAFTSAGKGAENDRTIFFSIELAPTKSVQSITSKLLNSTSLNITWVPLTLFEARGFPVYRVTLGTTSRRKRQSDSVTIITSNNFAVFTGLRRNTDYSVMVGVMTGGTSGFVQENSFNGTKNSYNMYKLNPHYA